LHSATTVPRQPSRRRRVHDADADPNKATQPGLTLCKRLGDKRIQMVEAAGVELLNRFILCNLQILKGRKNPKNDDSRGHRTVIVQSHERSHWLLKRVPCATALADWRQI